MKLCIVKVSSELFRRQRLVEYLLNLIVTTSDISDVLLAFTYIVYVDVRTIIDRWKEPKGHLTSAESKTH